MVDPTRATNKLHPGGDGDRGAMFADMDWALGADILVNHSGYDNTPLEKSHHPVVHVAHGRPRSSFLSETQGKTPIYSYWYAKAKDPRFKAVVTFWPQHVPYLKVMMPLKPVSYVPASVDLTAWTPDGPKGYGFHGKKGNVNIVLTDAWRDDVDPFIPLNRACLFAREIGNTKIHVYAKPEGAKKGWTALLRRIQDDGNLGEVTGWLKSGLDHVYRAASFMLTPNEIDTRSVREAMACGCPVVRATSLSFDHTDMLDALDRPRHFVRREAEEKFDPGRTALHFWRVLDGIGYSSKASIGNAHDNAMAHTADVS